MLNDLRYAFRMLIKNPGFAAVAVLTLALGIGANTAIFSLVNSLLLRPLPFRQPDRLVSISETSATSGDLVSGPHYLDWSEQSRTLDQVAAVTLGNQSLTDAGEPERLDVGRVSAGFFQLLGVQPMLGRSFSPDEDRPNAARVVVLSHRLWQRRFDADRNILGRSITLDDHVYSVVGVLPPDFRFLQPCDGWVPLALDAAQERGNQQISSVSAIARLKDGVSAAQANAELQGILERSLWAPTSPMLNGRVRIVSLHEKLIGGARGILFILLGAVNLILLIACTNVANLLLSRSTVRQKEFAIRTAVGAGRLQLLRQMLTEGGLLALAGAVLGVFLAEGVLRTFVAAAPIQAFGDIARMTTIQLDWRVLGFTLLVSCMAAILFGLVPAIQLSSPDIGNSLKERGHGSGYHRHHLRRVFMLIEVALAIILLTGAGLLVRSFAKLLEVNPGYQSQHLLTMRVSLPETRYAQSAQWSGFYHDLLGRLSALPGVESASAVNQLPLTSFMLTGWLQIPGQPRAAGDATPATPIGVVTSDYFRTMGIPLRSGRMFTDRDDANAPRAVILSETLARSLFGNTNPVGKLLRVPGPGGTVPVIVGVVGDIKHHGLDQEDVTPQVYAPSLQFGLPTMTIVIRTTAAPMSLASAVRQQVFQMDRNLPVYDLATMEMRQADSVASRRVNLLLLVLFALLALFLAAVGIYGVFSYAVSQRTQEFGVRMALGASRMKIVGMVVWESVALTAGGIVLGVIASLGATRVLAKLLYGIKPTDPATFTLVCLILLIIALIATFLPAWRAARVDPMVALRSE